MTSFWRRYKPFLVAGIQELITYRVNFFLYRAGDVLGAFVAFFFFGIYTSHDCYWEIQYCSNLSGASLTSLLAFSDGVGFPADLEKGPIAFDDTRRIG